MHPRLVLHKTDPKLAVLTTLKMILRERAPATLFSTCLVAHANATSGRHSPRTKFHLMLLVWFPRYVSVSILLPLIPFEPTDHFQANLTEISAKRVSSHKLHDGFLSAVAVKRRCNVSSNFFFFYITGFTWEWWSNTNALIVSKASAVTCTLLGNGKSRSKQKTGI